MRIVFFVFMLMGLGLGCASQPSKPQNSSQTPQPNTPTPTPPSKKTACSSKACELPIGELPKEVAWKKSAAFKDLVVFIGHGDSRWHLVAVDIKKATIAWQHRFDGPTESAKQSTGRSRDWRTRRVRRKRVAVPVLKNYDGVFVVQAEGHNGVHVLTALNASGKVLWEKLTPVRQYPFEQHEGALLVKSGDRTFVAYDLVNGKEKWQHTPQNKGKLYSPGVSVDGLHVYASSGGGVQGTSTGFYYVFPIADPSKGWSKPMNAQQMRAAKLFKTHEYIMLSHPGKGEKTRQLSVILGATNKTLWTRDRGIRHGTTQRFGDLILMQEASPKGEGTFRITARKLKDGVEAWSLTHEMKAAFTGLSTWCERPVLHLSKSSGVRLKSHFVAMALTSRNKPGTTVELPYRATRMIHEGTLVWIPRNGSTAHIRKLVPSCAAAP